MWLEIFNSKGKVSKLEFFFFLLLVKREKFHWIILFTSKFILSNFQSKGNKFTVKWGLMVELILYWKNRTPEIWNRNSLMLEDIKLKKVFIESKTSQIG